MAKTSIRKSRRSVDGNFVAGRRGKIRFGDSDVGVIVVEDRGPVGFSGRHLVRVRSDNPDADLSNTFEVPADELVFSRKHSRQTAK